DHGFVPPPFDAAAGAARMAPAGIGHELPPAAGAVDGRVGRGLAEHGDAAAALSDGDVAGGAHEAFELRVGDLGAVDPEAGDARGHDGALVGIAAVAAEIDGAVIDPAHAGVRIAAPSRRQSGIGLAGFAAAERHL